MSSPGTAADTPQPHAIGAPVKLRVEPVIHLSDEELFEVCAMNRELRIERSAEGELLITTPTGGETSARNCGISADPILAGFHLDLAKVWEPGL